MVFFVEFSLPPQKGLQDGIESWYIMAAMVIKKRQETGLIQMDSIDMSTRYTPLEKQQLSDSIFFPVLEVMWR